MYRPLLSEHERVLISPFGTTFGLEYDEKDTEIRKKVPLTFSGEENTYIALFDEDDVDFEIVVDNTGSNDRNVLLDLEIEDKTFDFVQQMNSTGVFKFPQSEANEFHFVSPQCIQERQALALAATEDDNIFVEVPEGISQIKFSIRMSPKIILHRFQIFVQTLTDKVMPFEVGSGDTVVHLKCKIQDAEGIPISQQRLVFENKPLEDKFLLTHYNIENGTYLYLVIKLAQIRRKVELIQKIAEDSESGTVSFGEKLSEINPYISDESIVIQPFIFKLMFTEP